MAQDRRGIREGMTVYSADGEKLGKVLECQADTFIIEKGFFFPKDYIARYEDVSGIDGEEASLRFAKDTFTSGISSMGTTEARGTASREAGGASTMRSGEDVRVPIAEEELDVTKRDREAGEVRLRKDVVTEHERVDVPVMKERVSVERVPTGERAASPGEGAFEQKTVSVPVHEEEVEIRKRPVVKEEVRLRKDRQVEQRAAEADLRKERVDIEGEGEAERAIRRGGDEDIPGSGRFDDPNREP